MAAEIQLTVKAVENGVTVERIEWTDTKHKEVTHYVFNDMSELFSFIQKDFSQHFIKKENNHE